MWCLPQIDDAYLARMEDVLELYERPYNPQQPVVCLDEKPVVLHREVRAPQAAAPGVIAKRDSEYQRRGTANVFCAVEARAGRHFTFPTARRSAAEFAKVAARIAHHYPQARTIHLVVDNLNIHCQKSLTDHFGNQQGAQLWRRFTLHYTPKHGSWLNQAEIEIGLFSHNVWAVGAFPIWRLCAPKPASGTSKSTAHGRSSSGALRASTHDPFSTTKRTSSRGQRTSASAHQCHLYRQSRT